MSMYEIPRFYLEDAPMVGRVGKCTLENFQGDPILIAELKELAKDQRSVVFLHKTRVTGAGKTHLAIGYMIESANQDAKERPVFLNVIHTSPEGREFSRREQSGTEPGRIDPRDYRFIRAEDLIGVTSKAGFENETNYRGLVKTKCVLIDEFGRTPLGFGKDVLDDSTLMTRFVSEREDWKRQTIITSPLSLADCKQRYDPCIIRRIEDGGGRVIELKTPRYRAAADAIRKG